MTSNFPASLDALSNPAPTDPTNSGTVPHASQHANINDIIEAIEAKLGIGAGGPPASAAVLRRSATGQSNWGQVVAGDVAGGGTANRVLRTNDGTNALFGQVQTADIAADQITNRAVSFGTTTSWTYGGHAAPGIGIAEMNLNITTDGLTSYLFGMNGSFMGTVAGDTLVFELYINGTGALPGVGTQFRRQAVVSVTNEQIIVGFVYLFTPPAAGTYAAQVNFWLAGTGTVGVVTDQREFWTVKLLR